VKHLASGKKGFTLAEMLLTLALVALVYTMISTILIQISRYVKSGREVAQQRRQLLRTVEELRYQLRSLYYPAGAIGLSGTRSPTDGWDTLRFITTNGRIHKGVVEASYEIQEYRDEENPKETSTALYYREFPFRRREFRPMGIHQEAPWKVYLKNVDVFEIQYSSGSGAWQREWELPQSPGRIRVRLERGDSSPDRIVFDVTPGLGAGRW
jgi:prepilin-type N-terminal cleavage/methylation domain-containing protein